MRNLTHRDLPQGLDIVANKMSWGVRTLSADFDKYGGSRPYFHHVLNLKPNAMRRYTLPSDEMWRTYMSEDVYATKLEMVKGCEEYRAVGDALNFILMEIELEGGTIAHEEHQALMEIVNALEGLAENARKSFSKRKVKTGKETDNVRNENGLMFEKKMSLHKHLQKFNYTLQAREKEGYGHHIMSKDGRKIGVLIGKEDFHKHLSTLLNKPTDFARNYTPDEVMIIHGHGGRRREMHIFEYKYREKGGRTDSMLTDQHFKKLMFESLEPKFKQRTTVHYHFIGSHEYDNEGHTDEKRYLDSLGVHYEVDRHADLRKYGLMEDGSGQCKNPTSKPKPRKNDLYYRIHRCVSKK